MALYGKLHTRMWASAPMKGENACEQGVPCPITPGSIHTFTTTIPVSASYPAVSDNIYKVINNELM